jgi:hypothetical protein
MNPTAAHFKHPRKIIAPHYSNIARIVQWRLLLVTETRCCIASAVSVARRDGSYNATREAPAAGAAGSFETDSFGKQSVTFVPWPGSLVTVAAPP